MEAHDDRFPLDPYPGVAPGWSFVHLDATSHPLEADPSALGGWRVAGTTDVDDWLVRRGVAPMAGRVPVLAFGSNRCPSKLTWLREHLGLAGPVVVLRARVRDHAAVWAAGVRARDGARPATLAPAPGAVESHAVWMATPEQVAVLDVCEGRGERYDLVRVHAGTVVTEDGALVDDPWTYWPATAQRAPLLVGGRPVRCSGLHQDRARDLVGEPAAVPGDGVTVEIGTPDPQSWPARVFVYGTLQPGGWAWPLLAPHAGDGEPFAAWMPGRVHDTRRGYPALRPVSTADGARATGAVVSLRSSSAALPVLDAYEGPGYRRVRSVTYRAGAGPVPGAVCWVWVWAGKDPETLGWPVVPGRWGTA